MHIFVYTFVHRKHFCYSIACLLHFKQTESEHCTLSVWVQCTACCIKYANDVYTVCIFFYYFFKSLVQQEPAIVTERLKWWRDKRECNGKMLQMHRKQMMKNEIKIGWVAEAEGPGVCVHTVQMNPIEIELQLVPNIAFLWRVARRLPTHWHALSKNGGRASEDEIQYSKHVMCASVS